ncbi:hypothetical protein V1511DRAFT_469832 [Dipodascopsis uninucleata]
MAKLPDSLQPTTELQTVTGRRDSDVRPANGGINETGEEGPNGVPAQLSELMTAAQQNDVSEISRLIESGEYSIQDTSPDGATALHWAAINNGIESIKYLIEHGAEVDRKGGDLLATPLHWACRVGLSYAVNLLIQYGADPLRTDSQGFNALHIAVHSSNVMLIVYLLHQGMPVDNTDPQGRTALHWAAYQGDALSVDILLRWGADVKLRDVTGFTALHWAVVRGNMASMRRLIEEGSEVKAETNDGKTPAMIAREMMCHPVWLHALKRAGRDADGVVIPKRLSKDALNSIVFFWPWLTLWMALWLFTHFISFVSIPAAILSVWGLHTGLTKFISYSRSNSTNLYKTPYLCGIFSGSAFFVAVIWITRVLPHTYELHPILNFVFFVVFGLSMFFFVKSARMDPGYVPKPSGVSEQRQIIEDLIAVEEYDSRHFCIFCFTRRPLRSKHCRSCERCVARLDHHCPWTSNCVAVRNHRIFLLYVILLEIGIPLFFGLVYYYITEASYDPTELPTCLVFNETLCAPLQYDGFTIYLTVWAVMQFVWVSTLTVVQLFQIARAVTTNEAYNLHTYGWMGGAGDDEAMPSSVADPTAHDKPGAFTHRHQHGNAFTLCCKLLGIKQFCNTVSDFCTTSSFLSFFSASASERHASERRQRATSAAARLRNHFNPFDHGIVSNCRDFWTGDESVFTSKIVEIPGVTGAFGRIGGHTVDYYKLWDINWADDSSAQLGTRPSTSRRRLVLNSDGDDNDYEVLPGSDFE